MELDERIETLKEKFNLHKDVFLKFNDEKKVFFVINKTSDRNYIKKFKKNTEQLSSDFYRLIDVNELDIEIDAAYEIVERPIKLDELFEIKKDKKAITKTISAVFYTLYGEPIKNEESNLILAKCLIKKFEDFIDRELFLEIYDYWLPLILIEFVALEKKYEDKISKKEFLRLVVIKKMREFFESASLEKSDNFRNFLKCYYDLFLELFHNKQSLTNQSHLLDLLNNFALPKFLNPMFKEHYLNFENQLQNLNLIFEKKNNKESISEIIDNFNTEAITAISKSKKNKGILNNKKSGSDRIIDFDFQSFENVDPIILSQVNLYDPQIRNEKFIQFSKNTDKYSDTINSLNLAVKQNSDILMFPEHGFNITDISKLVKFVKRTNIPIIGGLDYVLIGESVLNLVVALVPFPAHNSLDDFYPDCAVLMYPKRFPAPEEYEVFTNSSCKTNPKMQRNIFIPDNKSEGINFRYRGTVHSVLNCYEATDLKIKADLNELTPDIVHMITNNKDIDYYYSIGKTISRELMAISTITNYSKYGGTQVFIPFKERYKQIVSQHKGSDSLHVFTNRVDVEKLRTKRSDNTNMSYRQNPPRVYYGNAKGQKK